MSAFLFLLVIWPLDPTSNGIRWTPQPTLSKSTFRSLYFLAFLIWAVSIFFSKLHVNSSNSIFFWFLFIKTRSGLKLVVKMSGGIVPPFNQSVGRSARISRLLLVFFFMVMAKWCNTEFLRQVNQPSLRATGHQLRMCSRDL